MSVQWTENKGTIDDKVDKSKEELSATVEQKSLISIGDGVLLIQTILSYTVSLFFFFILVLSFIISDYLSL